MNRTTDEREAISLLQDLVSIRSENPPGDIRDCTDRIIALLESERIEYSITESVPGVTNLVARIKGTRSGTGKRLLFNSHVDTIPAGEGWSVDPFGGEIRDGYLYGRGSTDMKAGLATSLLAFVDLHRSGADFYGEVIYTAVGDEEYHGQYGTKWLLAEGLTADYAINCEPTNLDLCLGNRGLVMVDVTVKGRSSHGGRPGLGTNAVHVAAEIIKDLDSIDLESSRNDHFKDPIGSVSVVGIRGGDRINVIPDSCTFHIDRRLMPGESAERAISDIENVVQRHIARFRNGNGIGVKIASEVFHQPFWLDVNDPYVQTCVDTYGRAFDRDPVFEGKSAGTDASHLVSIGNIPTIIFGPGDYRRSHTIDEKVELAQLVPAIDYYCQLAETILTEE